MIMGVIAAGVMGLSLPAVPDWMKPHKPKPSERALQKQADKVRRKVYQLEGWVMTIQTDGFTGQPRCHLYSPRTLSQGRINYEGGALGFAFDRDEPTQDAWYRVDHQNAKRWQDTYPELVKLRIPLEGGTLLNPSGGVVLIPEAELETAREVHIRLEDTQSPKRFRLRGFQKAKQAALDNGCDTPESFERYRW
ncbi:hypothetical protein [Asticcacaulis sp. W401b]|uniref:hypothetical protein n=1 Tax=Asticcacaulis sp. W401b TaxID=3388666 RepID=UPI003970FDB2